MAEVIVRYEDQEIGLPVVESVDGNAGVDISSFRSSLGMVTLDRRFGNTAESVSNVSYIDGESGILCYGYKFVPAREH